MVNVEESGELVAQEDVYRRAKVIKDDIQSGRLRGHNIPPNIPPKVIDIIALNSVLILLAQQSRWN